MSNRLTEKQKSLLRYLVERVKEGTIEEDDIHFFKMMGGLELMEVSPPLISSKNNLLSLEKEGMIVISEDNSSLTCGLTALAFEVVERNFAAENPEINEGRLLTFLDSCFNLGEIEELCSRLNVDYENIAGNTKRIKAKNLIEYMRNRSRIKELVLTALSID